MFEAKDLTGQKFGEWTVICRDPDPGFTISGRPKRGPHWLVECSCGLESSVRGSELTKGRSKSCRACSNKRYGGSRRPRKGEHHLGNRGYRDLTGIAFGSWTVVSLDTSPRKDARLFWHCVCKCGTKKRIATGHLYSRPWEYGCRDCYINRRKQEPSTQRS
jgi:hypothetical protein